MSNYNHYSSTVIDFDNGYSVTFLPTPGLGSVTCNVRYKGEHRAVGTFMSQPGKNDGFYSYLSPEDFAEVLYRVSKAPLENV